MQNFSKKNFKNVSQPKISFNFFFLEIVKAKGFFQNFFHLGNSSKNFPELFWSKKFRSTFISVFFSLSKIFVEKKFRRSVMAKAEIILPGITNNTGRPIFPPGTLTSFDPKNLSDFKAQLVSNLRG